MTVAPIAQPDTGEGKVDSALAPRTDGGRLQTSHERPGLGTLTPSPTVD